MRYTRCTCHGISGTRYRCSTADGRRLACRTQNWYCCTACVYAVTAWRIVRGSYTTHWAAPTDGTARAQIVSPTRQPMTDHEAPPAAGSPAMDANDGSIRSFVRYTLMRCPSRIVIVGSTLRYRSRMRPVEDARLAPALWRDASPKVSVNPLRVPHCASPAWRPRPPTRRTPAGSAGPRGRGAPFRLPGSGPEMYRS